MSWYLSVLKQYAVFDGRARRKEYWMFALFNMIFASIAYCLDLVLKNNVVYFLYCLAVFIPGLAVMVRRLHDIGKSGWMCLIVFIPFIGSIWLLILMCIDSTPGENIYGLNPKENVEQQVIS